MTRADQLPGVLSRGGTYIVHLRLSSTITVEAGALGAVSLPRGLLLYVGSAARGLGPRVARHLCRADGPPHALRTALDWGEPRPKRLRWHLDYVVERPEVPVPALTLLPDRSVECDLAAALGRLPGVRPAAPRFGASDCRKACGAHLLVVPRGRVRAVERIVRGCGRAWQVRLTDRGATQVRGLGASMRNRLLAPTVL